MYGRDGQVDFLVPDLEVDVGEAEVLLPDQGPVTLQGLEGLGVHIQGVRHLECRVQGFRVQRCRVQGCSVTNLLWQLKVLRLELWPELGREDERVHRELLGVQLPALSLATGQVGSVQVCRCAGVQVCRCADVQVYTCTCVKETGVQLRT